MSINLTFAALSVSATLLLGNSPALEVASNQPVKKPEVVVSEVKPEVKPEVVTEEIKVPEEKVVTVQGGDTLQKIATANNTTYVRLFNANPSITNPDAINVGDQITIPTEDKALEDRFSQIAPVAPVAATKKVTPTAQKSVGGTVKSSSRRTGNGMWCTDYVHSRRPDVPIYGNAGYSWISSAQADGKSTGSTPQAGAIAVMSGHVAYVESVNSDGSYVVSEMGWNYKAGSFNQRTVKPGTFGKFIY